jgi:chromosome segregation ATPase
VLRHRSFHSFSFSAARLALVVLLLATDLRAQTAPAGFVMSTRRGIFTLPPAASLTNDAALLEAARIAELALSAAADDTAAAATDLDAVEADIAANGEALKTANETVTKGQAALQPGLDVYLKDRVELTRDDEQLQREKAPVQRQIDAYNARPEPDRSDAEYRRLAALAAPFEARRVVLAARLVALTARYAALEQSWNEIQQPLIALRQRDADLKADRASKVTGLGQAYRQLQAGSAYVAPIALRLAGVSKTASSRLTPIVERAKDVLRGLGNLGLEGER